MHALIIRACNQRVAPVSSALVYRRGRRWWRLDPNRACSYGCVTWRACAPFALHPVLGRSFGDGLPLHVARSVRTAASQRDDVINHVARAAVWVASLSCEGVPGAIARWKFPFASRGTDVCPGVVAGALAAAVSAAVVFDSGFFRSCAATFVPSFLVYSLTWTVACPPLFVDPFSLPTAPPTVVGSARTSATRHASTHRTATDRVTELFRVRRP